MNQSSRTIQWTVWGGLALIIAGIGVAFVLNKPKPKPASLPRISQVPPFRLTNQLGSAVSLETFRGKVWVADIIFTRCAGPCPEMTRLMSELQPLLPNSDEVKLVTLTTDPEFDTPAILKTYAERFRAQENRWLFLTGSKEEIARVAVEGLKLAAVEKDEPERANPNDLFIHSTLFVVVDRTGHLRTGIEAKDPEARKKIVRAVEALLREKDL